MDTRQEWQAVKGRRAVVPAHVALKAFPLETVALNMRTGQYHSIDAIGKRFLDTIEETGDLVTASVHLAREYEQPVDRIQSDLATFLAEMERRGLVELAD